VKTRARRAGLMLLLAVHMTACRDGDRPAADEHDEGEAAHADSIRVTLSVAAYVTAGIEVETALAQSAEQAASGLEVPGEIGFDLRRVALISPRVGGRLERVYAVTGDRVRAGQRVALLYTPTFITAQAEYLQARRRAVLVVNTPDAQGANALVAAAENRLRQIGAHPSDIERLGATGEVQEFLPISAPFSGSILESSALAGSAVESGAPLFKLADLTFVDVVVAVPEQSVPLVQIGGSATVRVSAYPNVELSGNVARMQQQLDEATRTVGAVIHVRNLNETLKPGMFATVRLQLPTLALTGSGMSIVITIPESALINEEDRRFVFVEVVPRTFERRAVDVRSLEAPGASQPLTNRVLVLSGLRPGERVVIRGAFTLKSELGKAQLGEHAH
jgi:RND family efflux transporter MFP subunit